MRYEPEFNPLKNLKYKNRKQLQRHLDFVGFNPDENKPYYCTICKKRFSTILGASNHVDFIHTELVLSVLRELS